MDTFAIVTYNFKAHFIQTREHVTSNTAQHYFIEDENKSV